MILIFTIFLVLAPLGYSETTSHEKLYGGLIVPQVRTATKFDTANDNICGGTSKDKVHYMTSQNMASEFKWYIETAFAESSCLIRISPNPDPTNDTSYVNLVPAGRTGVGADGFFPCGRTAGADKAYFTIPDSVDCDACVLEFIWRGPDFLVRQCADISVLSAEDSKCFGMCLNGGVCERGVCVCPPGYSGTYCASGSGSVGKALLGIWNVLRWILLLLLLLLILFCCCFACAKLKIWRGRKKQTYHTDKKYVPFDVEMPSQPAGLAQPANLARAESRSEY